MNDMLAWAIERIGEEGSLHELPMPVCSDDEVLVSVAAAGVNPIDWKIRDGLIPTDRSFPLVLGQDFAGKVAAVGSNVTRYAVGDRIFGIASANGSYAQYTVVPDLSAAQPTAKIPRDLDDADAASLPTAGLTALAALDLLGVHSGTVLLIAGAAGGVGAFATQVAHARGARVIGTVRSGREELARSLGVDEPIPYDRMNVIEAVRAGHPGVDALLDLVDNPVGMKQLGELVRPGGTAVSTIGAADVPWFAARKVAAHNMVLTHTSQSSAEGLRDLGALAEAGRLAVVITSEIDLARADRALALSKSGNAGGKIVVTIG